MYWKTRARIVEKFRSQIRFAREIGMDPSTVSKIMNGYVELKPKDRRRWAKALGVKPEQLFE